MTKILRAVGATFVYKMWGTSRHHAKFTGDHGSAIEVIRISDRSLRSVFAKNFEPCNFRLLQQYRHEPTSRHVCADVPFRWEERNLVLWSPSPETSMTFLPPVNSWSNRASAAMTANGTAAGSERSIHLNPHGVRPTLSTSTRQTLLRCASVM